MPAWEEQQVHHIRAREGDHNVGLHHRFDLVPSAHAGPRRSLNICAGVRVSQELQDLVSVCDHELLQCVVHIFLQHEYGWLVRHRHLHRI